MNPFELWGLAKELWANFTSLLALWPWFVACLLAGYLLGAWLGWRGAAVIAAVLGLVAFLRSRKSDDYPTDLPAKDAARPFRVPKRKGAAKQGAPWDNWSKS